MNDRVQEKVRADIRKERAKERRIWFIILGVIILICAGSIAVSIMVTGSIW